jgi:hypothetical protein
MKRFNEEIEEINEANEAKQQQIKAAAITTAIRGAMVDGGPLAPLANAISAQERNINDATWSLVWAASRVLEDAVESAIMKADFDVAKKWMAALNQISPGSGDRHVNYVARMVSNKIKGSFTGDKILTKSEQVGWRRNRQPKMMVWEVDNPEWTDVLKKANLMDKNIKKAMGI